MDELGHVWRRRVGNETTDVTGALATQWANPVDVLSILLIIGGDVVQRAFAQGTGKIYVPVCFSFGCVAYAFMGLVNIIGDGRLLPPPDYSCKVFNLGSGYSRDSKSFVIGRLLRDLEASEARLVKASERDYALKITVFRASYNRNGRAGFSWTYLHLVGLGVTALQLAISAIPYILSQDWSVMLITLAGTFLIQWAGMLPQWTAEKLPHRQDSRSIFALTSGNGSRDIMVILGYGNCLDLESLAVQQTPRNSRPWEKFKWLSKPSKRPKATVAFHRHDSWQRQAISCNLWPLSGFPLGFAITRLSYGLLSIIWLFLLINVSAAKNFPDSWCLLAIGGIGMFQNAWLAAKELSPPMRNIPLERIDEITSRKVMDGIMDFHYTYELGEPLRKEFFPGKLNDDEEKWWSNDCKQYDDKRIGVTARGTPRRLRPEKYKKFIYAATTKPTAKWQYSLSCTSPVVPEKSPSLVRPSETFTSVSTSLHGHGSSQTEGKDQYSNKESYLGEDVREPPSARWSYPQPEVARVSPSLTKQPRNPSFESRSSTPMVPSWAT
jgi:hypothetical protein